MRSLLLFPILLALPVLGHAQPRLAAYALGTAVEAGHAGMRLTATLGQPFVGAANTGSYTVEAGFWFRGSAPQATPIDPADAAELPDEVRLDPNYPNPFNPQTTIRYALPRAAHIRQAVHDVLGREVARLMDGPQAAGQYRIPFEARDLPSGVYVYRLMAGETIKTGTMLLLK